MKLLVAGGAGYIGATTTKLLLEHGHEVTVIDNLSTGHEHNLPKEVILVRADVNDEGKIEKVFQAGTYDVVLNFAAKIRVDESLEQPKEYFYNNTFGTNTLVDCAVKHGVKNFILSSTAAVYGEPAGDFVKEQDPLRPENPYGMSKLLAEKILQSYEVTHDLNWLALRYFNAGGAYGRVGPEYPFIAQLIPTAIHALLLGKTFRINGDDYDTPDGTCVRDFIHVLDIARAHVQAAEMMHEGVAMKQPINLGSSSRYSIREVIEALESVSGHRLNVEVGNRRDGDKACVIADNSLAKEILNWKPEHDLQKIIDDAWNWQKEYYQPEDAL